MKYIKSYKIFESETITFDYIKEIIEMEAEANDVEVTVFGHFIQVGTANDYDTHNNDIRIRIDDVELSRVEMLTKMDKIVSSIKIKYGIELQCYRRLGLHGNWFKMCVRDIKNVNESVYRHMNTLSNPSTSTLPFAEIKEM